MLKQAAAKIESDSITTRPWVHTLRLAVAGKLSASIAHEINQPLAAILCNTDAIDLMLTTTQPDLDEIRLILADIRNDSLRASQIISQMSSLVRKRPLDFTEINLQDLCHHTLLLITPNARQRGVEILTRFEPHAQLVHGDSVLLQQVILNLLLNAMDALADAPKSQAVIELSTSEQSRVAINFHPRSCNNADWRIDVF